MFDYAAYEKACAKVQEKNEEYLDLFEMELKKSGLSEKTVLRHLRNVDFYINTYLLREEPRPMEDGTIFIDFFLGDFFIRNISKFY